MARAHHLGRIVSSWWSIMFVFWTTSEIVCVCVFRAFVFVCQRWRVLLWCAVWMLWAARELLPISSKATARVEVVVAVVVIQAERVVVEVVQAVGVVVEAKPERLHRSSLSHTCHLQYAHKHTHTRAPSSPSESAVQSDRIPSPFLLNTSTSCTCPTHCPTQCPTHTPKPPMSWEATTNKACYSGEWIAGEF